MLSYFGTDAAEHDLIQLLGTTEEGTLLSQVANVAALGFQVNVTRGTLIDLVTIKTSGVPLVATVEAGCLPTHRLAGPHTGVVAGATDPDVWIYDPLRHAGPDAIPAEDFDTAWVLRKRRLATIRPRS